MRLYADDAFHIGSQHLRSGMPCQDYAISGTVGARAYAIVSDGCSSGGRTDVGARIIALAAAEDFQRGGTGQFYPGPGGFIVSRLGLKTEDLLATRLTACVERIGPSLTRTTARVAGDGVVAIQVPSGALVMKKIEWAGNMPCYPAYGDDSFTAFLGAQAQFGDQSFSVETWCAPADGEAPYHVETVRRAPDIALIYGGFEIDVSMAPIKTVAVFSDGVSQVGDVPWQAVVLGLMSFKSTAGDFVKRRMNRFLRDAEVGPIDDIAMAAILVTDEE